MRNLALTLIAVASLFMGASLINDAYTVYTYDGVSNHVYVDQLLDDADSLCNDIYGN